MGLVVIILILIITLMFIFGIKGDEWFNQGKPSHHTHYYYDDDEDEDFDSFNNYHDESESHSSPDNEMFYGGIPMGDSTMYLTDDDDICDEFPDEFY